MSSIPDKAVKHCFCRYEIATWRIVATLSLALFSTGVTAASGQVYLESNGYVQFEAEDAQVEGDWTVNAAINGHTGTGYLEWSGPNYFAKDTAGNGTLLYRFRIETAGNYEFRWRSRIAKGDSNTESNDSWVRFNTSSNVADEQPLDGWTKVYIGESDVWTWSARTVDQQARRVRQYFSQGDHTIELSGRSNGHAIDRLALYRYADVTFDSGLNGTLPLSLIQDENGALTDPNPTTVPEPEITLAERLNAVTIDSADRAVDAAVCNIDTLTLPLIESATVGTPEQPASYNEDELVLEAGSRRTLLAFDLSLLPPFSSASLQYSNVSASSNGTMAFYLGSHSDWVDDKLSEVPDPTVKIAEAKGGWDAGARYTSSLDVSLLPFELTTLLLTVQADSNTLTLATTSANDSLPILVVTGGADYCSLWTANVAEHNQNNPTVTEQPTASTKKSRSGAVSYWFALMMVVGWLVGKRAFLGTGGRAT